MSRQDMDTVLSDGINTAIRFIEKSGEFSPFGVVKTKSGEIRHIQVITEEDYPKSDSISSTLKLWLMKGCITGDYNTVAIVANVEIKDKMTGLKGNAISILIDEKAPYPILCYIPYEFKDGMPVLGDIKADIGSRIAFID